MTKIGSRSDIINYLIQKNNYKSYLEIGVSEGKNFARIEAELKHSVDPTPQPKGRKYCTHIKTSDQFFADLPETTKYDIVFIDGLHLYEQVRKDISNSLEHLSDNGVIVMHDCNPKTAQHATEKPAYYNAPWNGTTWKAFVELRMSREDLSMWTVTKDGCGIIKRGSQELYPRALLSYTILEQDRQKALNLITPEEFLQLDI